jgi:TIR domain-containing protein
MPCDVFISYVSDKDMWGRVSAFRIHLENELRGVTGNRELVVFQDKNNLSAGDVYPEVLAENVRAAKVLLILLSPGWLAGSRWCIHEYNIFKQSMALGTKKTVAPVVWYNVDDLNLLPDQQATLKELRDTYQWTHWEDLKVLNWDSETLNRETGKLAIQLKRYFPLKG